MYICLHRFFGYFELRSSPRDIVIISAGMLQFMRKPQSLTNIDEDPKVDADLVKRLAKAFGALQDLEE
jgi:hypothetical protein